MFLYCSRCLWIVRFSRIRIVIVNWHQMSVRESKEMGRGAPSFVFSELNAADLNAVVASERHGAAESELNPIALD